MTGSPRRASEEVVCDEEEWRESVGTYTGYVRRVEERARYGRERKREMYDSALLRGRCLGRGVSGKEQPGERGQEGGGGRRGSG